MTSPVAHLVIREPGRIAISVPLRDGLRIGRLEQCDVVLADPQVSRQHLQFLLTPNGWLAKDLGSRHGILINGRPSREKQLDHGDHLQIGNVLLVFVEESASPEVIHQALTELGPPRKGATDERRLALLYEVTRTIDAITLGDETEILGRLLDTVVDVLDCERALVGLSEPSGALRRIGRARGGASVDDVVISQSVLESTMNKRQGVIWRNSGERDTPRTMLVERIRSAMAVPILVSDRILGLLYADDRERADRFVTTDLDFLAALGYLIGAALETANRHRRMTELARSNGAEDDEILGNSETIQRLKKQIQKCAASNAPVLILGESGTGKELTARRLHALSSRINRPFVPVNCAAMPDTMIESELFGYEKGAFTGAIRDKKGKFELADRGTLFLDEIGDLSLSAQAKVLRALQEGEIQRVGSEKPTRVDVRIVAATHKDLRKEVEHGRFREDLFYRLDVLEILTPPLRERGTDIELLALALLRISAGAMGKRIDGFTPVALQVLRNYAWPGNVRELRNEMERAATNAESSLVDVGDMSPRLSMRLSSTTGTNSKKTLAQQFAEIEVLERRLTEQALEEARGNMSEAARLLGITWIMIKRRVDRFGLRTRDDRSGD